MTTQPKAGNAQPPLVDEILQNGKEAFDPAIPEESRQDSMAKFITLLDNTGTLSLMPVLNLLVQPGRVFPWLRTPLISTLARLPLRLRGVQDTIEFVLSVHPSTAKGNVSTGIGRGSAISHEAMNAISRLLSSPPAGMSAEEWFIGIAPQLKSLLLGEGEPEMDKVSAFVVGFGILGRKQYGAPGMPGWRAFVEPVYVCLDPSMAENSNQPPKTGRSQNFIETITSRKVFSTSSQVAQSILMLSTLVSSHPHPSLAKRLLRPILLPLWALSSWPYGNELTENTYRKPTKELLKTLLQLSTATNNAGSDTKSPIPNLLSVILMNLTFKGNLAESKVRWEYNTTETGGIQVEEASATRSKSQADNTVDFATIDIVVERFVALLKDIPEAKAEVSGLFMELCSRWLVPTSTSQTSSIRFRPEVVDDNGDVKRRLIEAKVLQVMMTELPDKLVDDSRQVLDLIDKVLKDFIGAREKMNETEDAVTVALSLLNVILTSSNFRETPDIKLRLESVQTALQSIGKLYHLDVSTTARNLQLLLQFRNSIAEPQSSTLGVHLDQHEDDRKSYNLAMSYLTATDSPTPVRAQGLELLSALIRINSPILDIPALLILFSSLLQDNEEYIYLRAIKSFIQLSKRHPKAVLKDLVDRYVDPSEEYDLDQRLRLGEALLQVAEENSAIFQGEIARTVCSGLLFLGGRRGYRPKTEKEQENANRVKRKLNHEAEEAWSGPVPQLDEVLEMGTQEENEILSQIVSGWESKRGSEDLRIRTSAVSILGSVIEANVEGIGSETLSTVVDLAIHILTLEPEVEKGILRRAAILLIMNFVKALDSARVEGKRLPFGFVGQSLEDVQRILKYIESTDSDGLVRQHARDVIEGLEAWQMNALLPTKHESGIQHLTGLSISPRFNVDGKPTPRIEEIE